MHKGINLTNISEQYYIHYAQGDFSSGDALAIIACYETESTSSSEYYLLVLNGIEPLTKNLICNAPTEVTKDQHYNEMLRLCKNHLDYHMVCLWNKYKNDRYHRHRYLLGKITLEDLKNMHIFGNTGNILSTVMSHTRCQSLKNDCEKILAIKQVLKDNLYDV